MITKCCERPNYLNCELAADKKSGTVICTSCGTLKKVKVIDETESPQSPKLS